MSLQRLFNQNILPEILLLGNSLKFLQEMQEIPKNMETSNLNNLLQNHLHHLNTHLLQLHPTIKTSHQAQQHKTVKLLPILLLEILPLEISHLLTSLNSTHNFTNLMSSQFPTKTISKVFKMLI